jgi:hypothetical protein
MDETDSIFYVFLVSGLLTFGGLVIRYCYKSKCSSIKCCGCEVNRNVSIESNNDLENNSSTNTITTYTNNPQLANNPRI